MHTVDKCRDSHGLLAGEKRELVETMLRDPNPRTWQQARHIVINPSPWMTLGMAVSSVTPARQLPLPDPFTVYRALRYALGR